MDSSSHNKRNLACPKKEASIDIMMNNTTGASSNKKADKSPSWQVLVDDASCSSSSLLPSSSARRFKTLLQKWLDRFESPFPFPFAESMDRFEEWSTTSLPFVPDTTSYRRLSDPNRSCCVSPIPCSSSGWQHHQIATQLDRHQDSLTEHHGVRMIASVDDHRKNDHDHVLICPPLMHEDAIPENDGRAVNHQFGLLCSSSHHGDKQEEQSSFLPYDLIMESLEPTPIGPNAQVFIPTTTTTMFQRPCKSSLSLDRGRTNASSNIVTSPGGGGVSSPVLHEVHSSICEDELEEQRVLLSSGGSASSVMDDFRLVESPVSKTKTPNSPCQEEDQPGRRFREYEADQWTLRFTELLQFKAVHGHCLVPHTYPSNPLLSQWVKRQRYQFKLKGLGQHSTLTDARQQKLEAADFVWQCHQASWHEKLAALKKFQARYGHCRVPPNYHDRSLAIWVKCQRRQAKLFRKGKPCSISKHRIHILDHMGFEWNPRGLSN